MFPVIFKDIPRIPFPILFPDFYNQPKLEYKIYVQSERNWKLSFLQKTKKQTDKRKKNKLKSSYVLKSTVQYISINQSLSASNSLMKKLCEI